MAGHTHVLETRCIEDEKLLDRFQRLQRYIERSYDPDQPCRKIILSVRKKEQKNDTRNHDTHKEGILPIHEDRYSDIVNDIVTCNSCVVCEILSNDRKLSRSLQMVLRVNTYTWFERELIVPHGLTKLTHTVTDTGPLYVFVDGCNVGNYKRDSKVDINYHFFISNIFQCIRYIQDKIAGNDVTITIILPKWTSKKRKMLSEECSKYNTVEGYVQWVEINSEITKSEDDRYMLEMALGRNSLIVSNDSFSDLREEKDGVWRPVIGNRILKFEILDDIDEHIAIITAYKEASNQLKCREKINTPNQTAFDVPMANQHIAADNIADVDTEIKIYGTDGREQPEEIQKQNSGKVHKFRFTELSDTIFNNYLREQFGETEETTGNSLNNSTKQLKEVDVNTSNPDTKQLCLISYKSTDVTLTIDSLKKYMLIRGVKEHAVSGVSFKNTANVQVVRLTVSEAESSRVQDPAFWPNGVTCRVWEDDKELTMFYLKISVDDFDENKIRDYLKEREISVKSLNSIKNEGYKFRLTLNRNSFQILSPDFWPDGIKCDPWRSTGPEKTRISDTATGNLQRLHSIQGQMVQKSSTINQRNEYFDSTMTKISDSSQKSGSFGSGTSSLSSTADTSSSRNGENVGYRTKSGKSTTQRGISDSWRHTDSESSGKIFFLRTRDKKIEETHIKTILREKGIDWVSVERHRTFETGATFRLVVKVKCLQLLSPAFWPQSITCFPWQFKGTQSRPVSGANSLKSGLKQRDTHSEPCGRNRRSENGHQRYRSNRQNTEPVSRDFASRNLFECLQDEEN